MIIYVFADSGQVTEYSYVLCRVVVRPRHVILTCGQSPDSFSLERRSLRQTDFQGELSPSSRCQFQPLKWKTVIEPSPDQPDRQKKPRWEGSTCLLGRSSTSIELSRLSISSLLLRGTALARLRTTARMEREKIMSKDEKNVSCRLGFTQEILNCLYVGIFSCLWFHCN